MARRSEKSKGNRAKWATFAEASRDAIASAASESAASANLTALWAAGHSAVESLMDACVALPDQGPGTRDHEVELTVTDDPTMSTIMLSVVYKTT